MPRKKNKVRKIFVLDTSVIIYNHNAIYSFEDNDIALPITVLEELDNFKKGNDTKNFEAREFIRIMDKMSANHSLQDWIQIDRPNAGSFKVVLNESSTPDARQIFDGNKPDHRILNAAVVTKQENPDRPVILVTKDINLRLKAKSMNIPAEDFETGKILDVEGLYPGKSTIEGIDRGVIDKLYTDGLIDAADIGVADPIPNHYFVLKNESSSALAYYNPALEKIERIDKSPAYKIIPRNAEQVFALHAIRNPKVKLVTLQGVAGTGKTLLALAGALDQKKNYKQIYLARPIVPLSNKDIGYLPGRIIEKMDPWLKPVYDNLEFLIDQLNDDKNPVLKDDGLLKKHMNEITLEYLNASGIIEIEALTFIRGRTFQDTFLIIDEAQNLTPHETKTIITRAGNNTKLILTGDPFQIDNPYLDERDNGLVYSSEKFKQKDSAIAATVYLDKCERSLLAEQAAEYL